MLERKRGHLLDGFERYSLPDWDGEDAAPVSAETIAYTRARLDELPDWLPDPAVAPGADGTIGLEWSQLWIDFVGPDPSGSARSEEG